MSVRLIAVAILAMLVAAPRPSAGGLQDHCIARSVEEVGGTIRVSADVDRNEVEQHLRTQARSAIVQTAGVTVSNLTLGRIQWTLVDPVTLGVILDVSGTVQVQGISLQVSATVSAQVKLQVVGAAEVHAELILGQLVVPSFQIRVNQFFTITVPTLTVQLSRAAVAGFMSQFQLPGTSGRLQRVEITSVDPSWFAVVVEIRGAPASGGSGSGSGSL